MTDTFTRAERSEIMRRVKGRDTSVELLLRKALWAEGLHGYRLDVKRLPGRPDVVFGPLKVALFVDGCFWHGCPRHCRMPSSNRAYWEKKIGRNVERDKISAATLREQGWRVIRFWEHQVRKDPGHLARRVGRVLAQRRDRFEKENVSTNG